MSELREAVTVQTDTGPLTAELMIDDHGLPTAGVEYKGAIIYYSVVEWPAAWRLSSPTCGPLYTAWQEIEVIRERLRAVEREVEQEERHG